MNYIAVMSGNPTAGETDGWEVSSGGLYTSPVSATLERNANKNIKCAVRCQEGYVCNSVSLTSNYEWLTLSVDGENFSNTISLSDVGDTNKIFYVKITAGTDTGTVNGAIALAGSVEQRQY